MTSGCFVALLPNIIIFMINRVDSLVHFDIFDGINNLCSFIYDQDHYVRSSNIFFNSALAVFY